MREDSEEMERWEARKRASTAQLLFRCARRLNERALERATGEGLPAKMSFTQLFPHIPLEEPGVRITELASRLGISKQAVGQTVDELEALGVVARVADPSDRSGLEVGMGVLEGLEEEIGEELGKARMRALHDALAALDELLESI
jgi:DNA-binding transcriptional ArsR family regulator